MFARHAMIAVTEGFGTEAPWMNQNAPRDTLIARALRNLDVTEGGIR